MIAELGQFALVLAFAVALVQSVVPLYGAARNDAGLMALAPPVALIQFLAVGIAFAALMHAFVTSDFSVANVEQNANSALPLLYKVTATWGSHEGSMVLWVLILTLFGAMVAASAAALPASLCARVLSIQGMVGAAFLAYILFTSNPFLRVDPIPFDGRDLNPLLQDPGLAFHPPFLYLGYVGLSMAFSFAVAALIEGKVDPAWARWVRPWTLLAWVSLTLGIAMGSWWAYYELGWGGWWFWDPVENASFMPWLVATALLHSAIVVERRDTLKAWTILLAILAFSLSLMGTFLVRSGVLTSVHAFATDPTRGVFILGLLVFAIGGSLTLFAMRAHTLTSKSTFSHVSRESALIFNNLFLTLACAAVLLGTLFPLFTEMVGYKVSVGAPYFNLVFGLIMLPLLIAVPFGPFLAWKRGRLWWVVQRLSIAAGTGLIIGTAALALKTGTSVGAALGIALGVFIMVGALAELAQRIKLLKVSPGESLRRMWNLPRAAHGMMLAHFGMGVLVVGVIGISVWKIEVIEAINPGQSVEAGAYTIRLDKVEAHQGPNYIADRGSFTVLRGGVEIATMFPEKRFYPVQGTPTTEAAIRSNGMRDIYVVLGDQLTDGSWTVRTYVHPLVPWIWFGAVIMGIGGLVSLSDRRYRIGAPAGRRRSVPATPSPAE